MNTQTACLFINIKRAAAIKLIHIAVIVHFVGFKLSKTRKN